MNEIICQKTNNNLIQEKSNKIQMLRGLAIIAVVCIHNTPIGLYQVYYRPLMNFCVGLFLFLSGMLSSAEKWNPIKRIAKVIPPYILWTFIYVIFSNIMSPTLIPKAFMKSLILADSAAIMYYIFVYCQLTLLIPLIDKIAKSKMMWVGFIITPLEIIIIRYPLLFMDIKYNKYISNIMQVSCLSWFVYFYLGYLLGNGIVHYKIETRKLIILWGISIVLQIVEGYIQFLSGEINCGTQSKITSILSGILFALMAYKYIMKGCNKQIKMLKKLGDDSFGIYFSHIAVMMVLGKVPFYSTYVVYPINVIVVICVTDICVEIGRRILGKYAKYLAL